MRFCPSFLAVFLLATAPTLSAQDLQRPAGWVVKADDKLARDHWARRHPL